MSNKINEEFISFYNVENLFTPDPPPVHKLDPTASGLNNWDERKYQNKLFKIAHVFQLMQESEGKLPLFIGVSEIQGDKPLQDLLALEPFSNDFGIVHYESMDERGVDVALIYDKTKIEILSSEPISYFFTVEKQDYDYYDTTRDVLYCKVKYENAVIHVFVLHLPSKREKDVNKPKRDYILADLNTKVKNLIVSEKESVIILGDFNENPDEENLSNFLYDDEHNKILMNPFLDLYKSGYFSTYHYKSGLLFDQMILSTNFLQQNFPLAFKESKVFNHEKLRSWDKKFSDRPFRTFAGTRYLGGYSDHFPILTVFEKTPKH
ncbi:endonuclease/exonuclease/phosphatase family protein [Kaistella carnis]|uniref:Endonuclease/exonuclease/phosphatase family protein n=1 Tax=Kaistella carnis TaxID=1241979 RepID=A0A3G8XMA8_9FLAO|nr:endonuclease/exonuclease/phosphatase family protein [Kaistella carnis]AZI34219.1 endonuclease/exonuclease/phosphatase family protein [Kaistella carnis]